MSPCVPCSLGYHNECLRPIYSADIDSLFCCCSVEDKTRPSNREKQHTDRDDLIPGTRGRSLKEQSSVRDPQSTGRKRAALDYPLVEGMICEWAQLKFAGGGLHPIIGCPGNPGRNDQKNRHHGPDKNTLNNSVGNVHRICPFCHNRWHAANDTMDYNSRKSETFDNGPSNPQWKDHDPTTRATLEEIIQNEIIYASKKLVKVSDDEHS